MLANFMYDAFYLITMIAGCNNVFQRYSSSVVGNSSRLNPMPRLKTLQSDCVSFSGVSPSNRADTKNALKNAVLKPSALDIPYLMALDDRKVMKRLIAIAEFCQDEKGEIDPNRTARVFYADMDNPRIKNLQHLDLKSRNFNLSMMDDVDDFIRERLFDATLKVEDFTDFGLPKICRAVVNHYVQNDTVISKNGSELIFTKSAKTIIAKHEQPNRALKLFEKTEEAMKEWAPQYGRHGVKKYQASKMFNCEIKLKGEFKNVRIYGKDGVFTRPGHHGEILW